MIKLLLLAANPTDTARLRLDVEAREIGNVLRQADFRDEFVIEKHFAVRVIDLQSLLLRHKPNIVHFSGHGNSDNQILVENLNGNSHPISADALEKLFSIFRGSVRCVLLNACYSETQAKAIAKHIDCVVGMSTHIGDIAAIGFASSFYQALGYGKDIKAAFDLGCVQINLNNLGEENTPKLINREGIDPSEVYLIRVPGDTKLKIPSIQSHHRYIESIRELLRATFSNTVQLNEFCFEHFSLELEPSIPLESKIELLIKHCQLNQELNNLLIHINEFDKQQYHKYARIAKGKGKQFTKKNKLVDQRSILSKFLDKLASMIDKIIPTSHVKQTTVKASSTNSQAEIIIEIQYEKWTPEIEEAAIKALAHKLDIPTNQIKVINMREGSIKLTLELPSDALERLISLYESDRSALVRDLGISYIMEIVEPYNLDNVRTLFSKGFGLDQLLEFCEANYKAILEDEPSLRGSTLVANKLVEYAQQQSQIPELLTLAKKINPKAYDNYGPYFNIARKPGQKSKAKSSFDKLTREETINSILRGFGTAFFGSMVLSLITIVVNRITLNSTNEVNEVIMGIFFSLGAVYVGNAVGNQVRIGAKHKRDPKLGQLAVTCYVVGFLTGYLYPFIILYKVFFPPYIQNKTAWLIISTCIVPPLVIFIGILLLIILYTSSVYTPIDLIFATISLVSGSFSAHRRASSLA